MSKHATRKNFRMLLPFLIIVAYLMSVAPINHPQASSYCNPPPGLECIELTVWSDQNCRCECQTQECCDFYYPGFVPYGCPGNPAMLDSLKNVERSK